MHDYTRADLDEQTRAILDFAVKLTREPHLMRETDVQRLREVGLNDEQVLAVVLIVCTFSFTNRLALGLGVEVPAERQEMVESWLQSPARDQEWLVKGDG